MKNIKLIALIILTTLTFSLNAQEKQNDATLEETIGWIKQEAIPAVNVTDFNCAKHYYLKRFYYDEVKKELKFIYKDYSKEIETTLYLNKQNIESLVLKKSNGDNRYSLLFRRELKTKNGLKDCIVIGFNAKDFSQRVLKAFEHLFYLLDWSVEIKNQTVDKNKF